MADVLRDNTELHRLELDVDGGIAVANYRLTPGVIAFTHTEVPAALQGQGIGSRLVRAALQFARDRRLHVEARCSFVSAYLARHPEYSDLTQ